MARKGLQTKLIENYVDNPSAPREIDVDGLAALMCGGPLLPTQKRFIFDTDPRKWYVGPIGCAKSTSLVTSILLPAILFPESRWIIARWTYPALEHSTMETFDEIIANLGRDVIFHDVKSPYRTVWIKSGLVDAKGRPLPPSKIMFMPLDDPTKLGSFRVNGVAVDEADEITHRMAVTLWKRCRFQTKKQKEAGEYGPFFLNLASNAPSRSHWLHKSFCGGPDGDEDADPKPWGKKYNPEPEENKHNLPPDYTDEDDVPPELRIRLLTGKCGPNPKGRPVFGASFNYQLHTSDTLRPIAGLAGFRGWDFGKRRPAVVWGQVTPEGWINRYRCVLGKEEFLRPFARRIIMLTNMYFPMINEWVEYVDPHGAAKTDTSEKSSIDILRQEFGLNVQSRDVSWDKGLEEMEKGLSTIKNGRPISMFNRSGCSILTEGYAAGYIHGEEQVGRELKNKPLKDGYYEHVMDADRYIMVCLNYGSGNFDPGKLRRNVRRIRNSMTGY